MPLTLTEWGDLAMASNAFQQEARGLSMRMAAGGNVVTVIRDYIAIAERLLPVVQKHPELNAARTTWETGIAPFRAMIRPGAPPPRMDATLRLGLVMHQLGLAVHAYVVKTDPRAKPPQ